MKYQKSAWEKQEEVVREKDDLRLSIIYLSAPFPLCCRSKDSRC